MMGDLELTISLRNIQGNSSVELRKFIDSDNYDTGLIEELLHEEMGHLIQIAQQQEII